MLQLKTCEPTDLQSTGRWFRKQIWYLYFLW